MSMLSHVPATVIARFLARFKGHPGVSAPPVIYENPLEEIDDAQKRGKFGLKLHFTSNAQKRGIAALSDMQSKRGEIRGEENYLHSSRRYPDVDGNTLPAGNHIPVGQYAYFSTAVRQDGRAAGFPSGFKLTFNETALTTPSQITQGQGFRIYQEGVAFNMEALADDIEQVLDSGDFQYTTEANTYTLYKGPFAGWPGGWGVSGMTDRQGTESAHNGIADPRAVKRLAIPRVIPPLKNFGYTHNVGVDGKATYPVVTPGAPLPGSRVWTLSDFVIARVVLWGDQMTKVSG